ncbi:hypothetical protein [Flagellimonas meishanensis]|uniref:hypothetical protein n=1 Tax=Flagellimonas meishanensis TaxID=2873264 RepID=UPI001CA727E3|nr:hypothetical protein [[Muricauda] meishanensis]
MKTRKLLQIVLAVLGGEMALILFATIAQEVLFDGVSYHASSMFDIIFGGLATFIAAVLAGIVARFIIKNNNNVVPIAISVIIIAEMTYLILTNKTGDPVWFDIMAGGSLVVGIWLGFNYQRFFTPKEKIQVS